MSRVTFEYQGSAPPSKSILNRILILASYHPQGLETFAPTPQWPQDSIDLLRALKALQQGEKKLHVGEGGTTLRFLALRVARFLGEFELQGTQRLFERPQEDLERALIALGAKVYLGPHCLRIHSKGWCPPQSILTLTLERTSQVASGIFLNAWGLPQKLGVALNLDDWMSGWSSYLRLTFQLLPPFSNEINLETRKITWMIPPMLSPPPLLSIEPDWSSVATLIVGAWIGGKIKIPMEKIDSAQPDSQILQLFPTGWTYKDRILSVEPLHHIPPFEWNFESTPDLFPILAVLASFSEGECLLRNFDKVTLKESNRLKNTLKLLNFARISYTLKSEKLLIQGKGIDFTPPVFRWESDRDHRMAMAAGLFQIRQKGIIISDPTVVKKSFPNFWQVIQRQTNTSF